MSSRVSWRLLFFLCVLCLAVFFSARSALEHFNQNSIPVQQKIAGPLPDSVQRLLAASCVVFYSDTNFMGPILGCLPAGHHFDSQSIDVVTNAQSFRVPEGYLIQFYGENGETFANVGTLTITNWQPNFKIKQFVISQSDLVTITNDPPQPVADDWAELDKYVVKNSADFAKADWSNIKPFNFPRSA